MTSDMHLPPEKRRQLPHMVWASVFPDIRYDKASPSHLLTSVDKQLLPKTATLPVLCYICLNSLLVSPCWRHFPESSVHLVQTTCWGLGAARRPGPGAASPGRAPGPHGSSPHPSAASEQVADWKARLFLHGLDRSVHHVVLSNRTCWPSGGSPVPFGGSHLRSCFWMSPCVQTALSPSSCQTPDSILFPGAGAVMADESSWRR